MNTDKTLTDVFCERSKYPIWYYKELEEASISYVIYNLLKETFVVEINNKKVVITFGKNRKHEIGATQSCNEGLDFTSYETLEKAFREGKWFVVSEKETTEEFKEQYKVYEENRKKKEEREFMIDMLSRAVEISKKDDELKEKCYQDIKSMNDNKLKELTETLFSSFKK